MIDLEVCLRCHRKLPTPGGICTACVLWYQGESLIYDRDKYRCKRCHLHVTPGFFCAHCYETTHPSKQAMQIANNPHRLCPHCGRLKYHKTSICPSCGPVTRFEVPVVQLTPEQLAQWLRGGKDVRPLCVNCARVAPDLCAYHIMDLSGCDLDEAEEVSRSTREWYHCPHCNGVVRRTEFCCNCYYYVDPARLMDWITKVPMWRCEDCNAPRIFDPSGGRNMGPCGRCLRRGFTAMTPLTPEQLAHWVKGMKV